MRHVLTILISWAVTASFAGAAEVTPILAQGEGVSDYHKRDSDGRRVRRKMMALKSWLRYDELPLLYENDGRDRGIRPSFRKGQEKFEPVDRWSKTSTRCPLSNEVAWNRGSYYHFAGLEGVRLWKTIAGRYSS